MKRISDNKNEQTGISRAEQRNACESHIKTLEKKEQEISVGAKLSFRKIKLEEYKNELIELSTKQGEQGGQD